MTQKRAQTRRAGITELDTDGKGFNGHAPIEINVREDIKTQTSEKTVKRKISEVQRSTVKNAKEYEHGS